MKIVKAELKEVIGFHPVTPSICGTVPGGTLCIIHPRQTVGGFRHAFPSCAVVQSGGVGPAVAFLCPAVVQRSEEGITLVQAIKHGHLQVT